VCRFFLGLVEGELRMNNPMGKITKHFAIPRRSFPWTCPLPIRLLSSENSSAEDNNILCGGYSLRSVFRFACCSHHQYGRYPRETRLVVDIHSGMFQRLHFFSLQKLSSKPQEGIFTFAFGLSSFFFTPRSPAETRFLTKREREHVNDRLREDGVVAHNADGDRFAWVEVGRAFMLPQVFFMAIIAFMSGKFVQSVIIVS
jgi:hypothetical protein